MVLFKGTKIEIWYLRIGQIYRSDIFSYYHFVLNTSVYFYKINSTISFPIPEQHTPIRVIEVTKD